jgi:hypothetical protein
MMRISRSARRFTAWVAVVALLFMQVAVAAYACPYVTDMRIGESAMSRDCTTGAGSTDQSNLCKAHSDAQSQLKGDQLPAPPVAPVAVVALPLTPFATFDDASESRADSYAQLRLAPDGSPPIFVRHVVFRK